MNVERMTRVLGTVRDALIQQSTIVKAQALQSAIERSASNPGNLELQQEVANARTELEGALTSDGLSDLPQLDAEILDELGIAPLVGSNGLTRIDRAMTQNEITLAVAAAAVAEYVAALQELLTHLQQFGDAVGFLRITPEELDQGTAELAVLIPRTDVREEAILFARELVRLDTFIRPFYELNGETPEPSRLASVSSSDYGVFLDVAPHVALSVAGAVAFVLSQYKKILEIRQISAQLEHLKSDEDGSAAHLEAASTALAKAATETMTKAIDQQVESLDLSLAIDDGRKHELRMSLRASYRYVAERVDRGYNFDVRVGADPEPDDEGRMEPDGVGQAIRDLGPELAFVNRSGKPILELNASDEVDSAAERTH